MMGRSEDAGYVGINISRGVYESDLDSVLDLNKLRRDVDLFLSPGSMNVCESGRCRT